MTNIQHPITPPPELMQRWREQAPRYRDGGVGREYWLMARALGRRLRQNLYT